MRASGLLIPTLRDPPADAVAVSHQLLVRAGFTRQIGAGLWSFMPLGFKSLRRMMQIIREEMDAIGGQEFLLPVLHPAEIWRRSGRYDIDAVFKLEDRSGRDLVLAITHEEIVAFHAATEIRSYRDLPQIWYHQQTKERDEPRPQGGLLRTREFIMKDSYTLDRDRAGLDEGYAKHEIAYARIFDRAGLQWYKVESDVGMMGGFGAHEYMAPSPTFPPDAPAEEVETPGVATIAELAQYLGIDERLTVKAVMVVPEDERGGVVLALVRGDHRVHDLKLAKALGTPFRAATPDEIRDAFGADPGSIGAVGVRDGALREIVADEVLREGAYVAGANRNGWHLRNVVLGRDYQARVADIRFVEEGELSVGTGSPLRIVTAIEVGNIFKLGTSYSEKFGATYLDENGVEQTIWMGSYGIGPARTVAAVVEQHNDEHGIVWPREVAPFDVWITAIGDEALAAADELDRQLGAEGLTVLVDDRPLSPGVRFADADLVGVPVRVTIGKRLQTEGTVEVRLRSSADREPVALADALPRIVELAAGA